MAVTIGQLAAAIRLTDGSDPPEPQLSILTRLSGVADAFIGLVIPDAPTVIQDECKVRLAAYLYDAPSAGRGDFYGNAWRNSGAGSLASRWHERRAADPLGSPSTIDGAPTGTGVSIGDVRTLIREGVEDWSETGNPDPIPLAKLLLAPGGTDQAARDLAAMALALAQEKITLVQAIAQIAAFARVDPSGADPPGAPGGRGDRRYDPRSDNERPRLPLY